MRIGLALGGGGVMGVAHLALLEELDKNNIRIDAIAGTSAGAIIAGLYASGGTERIWRLIDILKQRQYFTRKGLFLSGKPDNLFKKIEQELRQIFDEDNFDHLKIPVAIIATDIDNARAVSLRGGSLTEAILASSAYPGVFPYRQINNIRLVDGGVSNNLPADVVKEEFDVDFVIASSLNQIDKLDKSRPLNRAYIAARSLDIMQLELEKVQIGFADYCFLPPVEEYRWYSFVKMDEIYQRSKEYAASVMPELKLALASKQPKNLFHHLVKRD